MKILGVDDKGRPIVADLLPPEPSAQASPEATPQPQEAVEPDPPEPFRWGKALFAGTIAVVAGFLIASCVGQSGLTRIAAAPQPPKNDCDRYLKPGELRDQCNLYTR